MLDDNNTQISETGVSSSRHLKDIKVQYSFDKSVIVLPDTTLVYTGMFSSINAQSDLRTLVRMFKNVK